MKTTMFGLALALIALSMGVAYAADPAPAAGAAPAAPVPAAGAAPGAPAAATPPPAPAPKSNEELGFANDQERFSYAIGMQMGKSIANMKKQMQYELNIDVLIAAMRDSASGANMKLDDASVRQAMKDLNTAVTNKQKSTEESFLAENGKKEGVQALPSGVQYKVIKDGDGAIPTEKDKVKVHYTGTLLDGTKFDSSVDRGEPAEFQVSRVIKGWTEALTHMKKGSKWQVWIPYALAYGERGTPSMPGRPGIPPFSTLSFEVELLDITPVTEAEAAAGNPHAGMNMGGGAPGGNPHAPGAATIKMNPAPGAAPAAPAAPAADKAKVPASS